MWLYQIAAHSLSLDDELVSTGLYSGHDPHVNDVSAIRLVGIGPIPPGDYTILTAYTHPHLGPLAMPLQPYPANEMYGRGSFYIHGDSVSHPGAASEGCIIAPHEIRVKISNSADRLLRVSP